MYIFSAESSIAELIRNNKSLAFHTQVSSSIKVDEEAKKIAKASRDLNLNDEDLSYLDSILASVGYNGNDDLFTKEDIWLARNSPINKQFNYMHNQRDIIGHMFASNIFDLDGNKIPDETAFDDIPDNFDIVVSSVLYKTWPQPELQERMNSILAGIANGEWYVSMEAYFKAFDYGLIHKNQELEIIPRDKTTAHMSKYLRAYGGSGEYNNVPIKRVLRRFSFSGKGLVNCPANERSIIFDDIERLKKYSIATIKKENNMDELEKAKAELVKAKLETDSLDAKVQSLASEVESKTKQITEANAKISELTSAKAEIEKNLEEVKAELKKSNDELGVVKAAQFKSDRINKLIKAGVKDNSEIESIFNEWQNVSDSQFDKVIALHVKNNTQAVKEEDKEDKKEEEEMAESAKASLDTGKVEKDKETTLAVDLEDKTSKVITTASAWLSTTLKNKKKGDK